MYGLLSLFLLGVLMVVVGHYRGRLSALTANPVTRVKFIPRTLFDEQMGVDWTSDATGSELVAPAGAA